MSKANEEEKNYVILTAQELLQRRNEIFRGWECLICGFCCERFKFGLKGDDWERWGGAVVDSNIGRYPLRNFVNQDSRKYSKDGDLFFHPETGEWLENCPFLGKQGENRPCLLHNTGYKPTTCSKWHQIFVDLRCTATRKIVKRFYGLKFENEEEEYVFFKELNLEFQKLQHEQLFLRSLKSVIDLCIEGKTSEE